jgi:hypothetical protein
VAAYHRPATLRLRFQGGSNDRPSQDHHVVVLLNGSQIGEGFWDALDSYQLTLSLDPVLLQEGDNILELSGRLDTGALYSAFYLDWFQVSYQRLYRAADNHLLAPAAGQSSLTIDGFTEPEIRVYEVSDPRQPQTVTNLTVEGEAGQYRVSFAAQVDGLYLALTQAALRGPVWLRPEVPSSLQQSDNGADYIVIAPAGLKDTVQSLADYRQGQGLATMVVDVADIYDEFNFGLASPEAIQAFLAYAYQQYDPAPRYVLLAGNGTLDYKNRTGYDDNLVPPLLAPTPFGLFVSDNKYGDLVGADEVPEIALARLPATSAAQLQGMIDKILIYESNPSGDWSKQVMLLADSPDNAGNFPADSDAVAGLIPTDYGVDKIYLSDYSLSQARQQLLSGLNEGVGLVNYIGHAGLNKLARQGLLTSSDVGTLTNGQRLPVVTAMTCVVGRYGLPGYDSLGETLVQQSDGGAVAVWAPTSVSFNREASRLDQAFYRARFGGSDQTLGDIIRQTQADYISRGGQSYLLNTYNLLGDPALRLGE